MNHPVAKLTILLVFVILITLYLYSDVIFNIKKPVSTNTENFLDVPAESLNTAKVPYEFDDYEFPPTAFEVAVLYGFNSKLVACQVVPAFGSNQCKANAITPPIVKYKYPVALTRLPNGKTAAVFNDGRIYLKDRPSDKLWHGPV